MSRPLRIAMLSRSTNPCDVVVYALAAADALIRIGHEALVHAPAASTDGLLSALSWDRSTEAHLPVHRQLRELRYA
jgi:hypothetical protein